MEKIINKFMIKGEVISCNPFGNGHINATYKIETTEATYVLQKINNYVFTDSEALMNNIFYVTTALSVKGIRTLDVIKTLDGKLYTRTPEGDFRMYTFIDKTMCLEKCETLEQVYNTGKAFGLFHKQLSDLDPDKIFDVIPNFHNTPVRYQSFLNAVKRDEANRKQNCLKEIEDIMSFAKYISLITDGIKAKTVRNAITHNDPKINNVLFSKQGEIVSVIDFDTIMTGSILYDVGDALRSLFTGDNEDTRNLDLLKTNPDIFESYIKGYLSEMKYVMLPKERELLPYAPLVLTAELSMRFLEDYLNGDKYFGVKVQDHNLIRARTQIALCKDIIANIDTLIKIASSL